MKYLEYDTALTAGTWYLWRAAGRRVIVSCPLCAGIAIVELDDIEEDGTVMAGFACKRLECDFSGDVSLKGWKSGGSE